MCNERNTYAMPKHHVSRVDARYAHHRVLQSHMGVGRIVQLLSATHCTIRELGRIEIQYPIGRAQISFWRCHRTEGLHRSEEGPKENIATAAPLGTSLYGILNLEHCTCVDHNWKTPPRVLRDKTTWASSRREGPTTTWANPAASSNGGSAGVVEIYFR